MPQYEHFKHTDRGDCLLELISNQLQVLILQTVRGDLASADIPDQITKLRKKVSYQRAELQVTVNGV